jgi:TatA/E family protein of Tat protein translocase
VAHPMLPSRPHGTGVKGWSSSAGYTPTLCARAPAGYPGWQDHSSEGTDMGTDVWVVVVIGAVLLFGATKLPQIARNLGKAQGEFKKGLKEGHVEEASTPPAAPIPPAQAQTEPPTDGDAPTV